MLEENKIEAVVTRSFVQLALAFAVFRGLVKPRTTPESSHFTEMFVLSPEAPYMTQDRNFILRRLRGKQPNCGNPYIPVVRTYSYGYPWCPRLLALAGSASRRQFPLSNRLCRVNLFYQYRYDVIICVVVSVPRPTFMFTHSSYRGTTLRIVVAMAQNGLSWTVMVTNGGLYCT